MEREGERGRGRVGVYVERQNVTEMYACIGKRGREGEE